jgi:hypothetical protein
MSERQPADDTSGDLGEQQDAPEMVEGTDISVEDSGAAERAGDLKPATSDPGEYVDDGELGGTGGPSPGGAG